MIRSTADVRRWLTERGPAETAEPFTYVVTLDGRLCLAPRRSEHVVCAGGREVLGAGEIRFGPAIRPYTVTEVSNLSTGYCPDLPSWRPLAHARERAGLTHPGRFTHEVVFRRCPVCRECSVVREGDFVCVFCGGDLPAEWNITL